MEYKEFLSKPIAKFVVATSNDGRLIKKLPIVDSYKSQQYSEFMNYIKEKESLGKSVVKEEFSITQDNPYAAFLKMFWPLLSRNEKELLFYSVCYKLTGKPFAGTQDFGKSEDGTFAPFCFVDDKISLNCRFLDAKMRPLDVLSMLMAIPFEIRNNAYQNKPTPKNILGFESFEELGCRYPYYKIMSNAKTPRKVLDVMHQASVQGRAYMEAEYAAINTILEEVQNFTCLPASDCILAEKEIERLLDIENNIDETLDNIEYYRNIEYIAKVNELFNAVAEQEKRTDDIVKLEDALKHFGYYESPQEQQDEDKNKDKNKETEEDACEIGIDA